MWGVDCGKVESCLVQQLWLLKKLLSNPTCHPRSTALNSLPLSLKSEPSLFRLPSSGACMGSSYLGPCSERSRRPRLAGWEGWSRDRVPRDLGSPVSHLDQNSSHRAWSRAMRTTTGQGPRCRRDGTELAPPLGWGRCPRCWEGAGPAPPGWNRTAAGDGQRPAPPSLVSLRTGKRGKMNRYTT